MIVMVGLGNPGNQYAYNRHNIGFMALDDIAERHRFSPFKQKFNALLAEGRIGDTKIIALKPQTFMNRSGQAVGEAIRFYKVPPGDVIVFYDDLDLAPGKVRVKRGGGAGGHNGLRSIDQHIGPEYWRVRIGIGHPGDKDRVTGYVLSNFAGRDEDWLDPLLEAMADAAPHLVDGAPDKFMTQVAQKTRAE
ncbi:aminoacyl-tRNA hydrolase [Fodinicurvata sp. EGI_FJ10296]|jgi:PTH1 family peptidyl-tRNA hydrolase|uniref:aminoacyl-tRNA hydrolase n=1 Tax=Fodinicurvata sp. EGI_FJ10296 TaxID=3231908 RepID=UPI003453D93C